MTNSTLALGVALGLALPAGQAMASTFTFGFEGVITGITDSGGYLDDSVSVGSRFSGTYGFDPAMPDSAPSARVGDYRITNGPSFFSLQFGNYNPISTFPPQEAASNGIHLQTGHQGTYSASSSNTPGRAFLATDPQTFPLSLFSANVALSNPVGRGLQTDALPMNARALNTFAQKDFSASSYPESNTFNTITITGRIEAFSNRVVPEPGQWPVAALGIVGGFWLLRSQKNKAKFGG